MKNLKSIENEITELTAHIETNYPELYTLLDENPMTIPSGAHPKMTLKVMQDYLESLKQILDHYIKNHKEV